MNKRFFDLLFVFLATPIVLPVMAIVAILIRVKLGTPILFRQVRPGLNGLPFTMYKFRTMRDAIDIFGHPLPDAARMTSLGRILRASSLDELPELWNVVKGDMSLVGPRPLLMDYLPLYSSKQSRRHEVRPGITGWAQVNGRNSLSWDEKFELDVWYVDNHSVWVDVKIIFLTLKKVAVREGINADNDVTMKRFEGSVRGRDSE